MSQAVPALVLLSGGMDSITALYHAHADPSLHVQAALSFHYGSKHNDQELQFAKLHADRLGVPQYTIRLPFINETFHSALLESGSEIPDGHYEEENMKQTVVPFRNGIMLSVAAGFAESRQIKSLVIAAHSGDHAIYPDCREDFMQSMAQAIRAGTYEKIDIHRPFIDWNKTQIALRGHELQIPYELTWSCYKGGSQHCGTCGTCVERREAFLLAGIEDPTVYQSTAPLPTKR